MVGEIINAALEVASSESEICGITQLLHGAEAVVVLFLPFCYGDTTSHSMESLVIDINQRIDEFNQQDLRVICITRCFYLLFSQLNSNNSNIIFQCIENLQAQ